MALQARLDAFEELLRLSGARVDSGALAEARDLLHRAGERRRLSLDHTVVALAGATGSGKSSLFNAVCGRDLSAAGVRRPTTTEAAACAWDPDGAGELLDRLEVPARRRFSAHGAPAGLVLVDLPDHDSADVRHRAEVDRLVGLADVLVWVLDPEKYADASVHERYLRPLAGHADVMLVVLNKIDRLPEDAVPQCTSDLRRLLDEDGLAVGEHGEDGAQVLAVSALTGEGVDEFRAALDHVVRERGSADRRIRADLDRAAAKLRTVYVGRGLTGLGDGARERFLGRLGDAVGAAAAGEAAERAFLRDTAKACAPPYRRGLPRGGAAPGAGFGAASGAVPGGPLEGPRVLRPVVDEAVRDLAREASVGLPGPWAEGVRQAAEHGGRELGRDLDRGVDRSWPGGGGRARALPWWGAAAGVAQWVLLAVACTGAVGVATRAAGVWAWPWWLSVGLLAGGLLAGPGLGGVCRDAAPASARRHGEDVERALREAVEARGEARVLVAVEAELRRYRAVRERFGAAAES